MAHGSYHGKKRDPRAVDCSRSSMSVEAHNKEIVMAKASEHIFEISFHRENGRISAGNLNSIATARQCCTMLLDK